MKKKGNKKMLTPRQKVIHNPIPTSATRASAQALIPTHPLLENVAFCLSFKQRKEHKCILNLKCVHEVCFGLEAYRDGVMNYFLS